ncbi:MAG: hypothetical protein ABI240_00915 [Sphingomonas sp.]
MRHSVMIFAAAALACSAAVTGQTAPAQQDAGGGIMDKALNTPGANWAVYGTNQSTKVMSDPSAQIGQFVRATVTAKGTNAWDIGANSPIQKPMAAGDTILVAIYLRAPDLKDGETMPLPYIGANGAAAPYDGLVNANVTITNKWRIYYASGKAAKDFPGGSMNAAVHLASDKHVVDLGPVFVLDFGQNYTKKLPDNNTPQ